jgi:hypothetical protein
VGKVKGVVGVRIVVVFFDCTFLNRPFFRKSGVLEEKSWGNLEELLG